MAKQAQLFSKTRNLGGRDFALTSRDTAILTFIWSWKLASTTSIHEEVGKPNTPYSTFKTLERLQHHGYVECIYQDSIHFKAWQLTDKGFGAIRQFLGDLKEEGFLSENQIHDWHVLAFQLGEWAGKNFSQVTHFTEQELRRRPMEYYPDWVPKTGSHRSDGYTEIQGEKRVWHLSYEVELWPKSLGIYESLIRYYRMYHTIDRVYWLVDGPNVFNQIVKAKTNAKDPDDNYHLFVQRSDYERMGWDAPVRNARSENLFTIRKDMQGLVGTDLGLLVGNKQGQLTYPVHYNKSKIIGKPRPY